MCCIVVIVEEDLVETADNQLLYALYSVTPVLHSGDSEGEPGEDNYCTVRFVPCDPCVAH